MSNSIKKLKGKITFNNVFYKKLMSVMLVFVMSFTCIPISVFAVEDSSLSDADFLLTLKWLVDKAYTDEYNYDSNKNEDKLIRLVVNYKNNSLIGSIEKDGIIITVPGIRKLKDRSGRQSNNNAVLLDSIGVDSSSTKGNSIWYYVYDSTNDEFVIKNKNKIDFNSTFLGSFEICFKVSSRLTEHNFQKDLQAQMKINTSEETEFKPVLSNTVTYKQTRETDTYNITFQGESLKEKDGLGVYAQKTGGKIEDFCWVKYNLIGMYNELARGIQQDEKFYFYFPKDAIVLHDGPDKIEPCDWVDPASAVTIDNIDIINSVNEKDYDCWVCTKDISLNTPKDYFKNIVVAYPKDKFYKEEKTNNVTSYVQLRGTYFEENDSKSLSWHYVNAELVAFPEYPSAPSGRNSIFEKVAHGYNNNNNYINRVDLTNNRRSYYSNFNVSSVYPRQGSYSIILTDEQMALLPKDTNNTNGVYNLKPYEYSFYRADIPSARDIYDANGFNINKDDRITIKVFRKIYNIDEETISDYKEVYSNTYDGKAKEIFLREGLKNNQNVIGVKFEISGLTTSFKTNGINVLYSFNVTNEGTIASAKKFTNYAKCLYDYGNEKTNQEINAKSSCAIDDMPNMVNVNTYENFIRRDIKKDETDDSQFHLSGQLPYTFNIQDGLGTQKFTCAFVVPNDLSLSCDQNDIKSLVKLLDCHVTINKSSKNISDKIDFTKSFIGKVTMGGKERTFVALAFDFGDKPINSSFNLVISNIPMHVTKDNIQSDTIYEYNMPVMAVVEKPDASAWSTNVKSWPYVTTVNSNKVEDVQPLIDAICEQTGYIEEKICTSYMYKYVQVKKTISQFVECRKSVSSLLTNDYQRIKYTDKEDGTDCYTYASEDEIPQVYHNGAEYRYKITLDTAIGANVSNVRVFDALECFKSKSPISESDDNSRWKGIFDRVDYSEAKKVLRRVVTENGSETLKPLDEKFEPKIYYSEKTVEKNDSYEESLDADNGWFTPENWGKNKADIKSIAVDFSKTADDEQIVIPGGKTFYVEIVMKSPEVNSNNSTSPKFNSFTENDSFIYLDNGSKPDCLSSNPVPVKLVQYKGSINIIKKDGVDKETLLPGAVFEVTNSNNPAESYTVTTKNSGKITLGGLTCGQSYDIKEIDPPTGYEKSNITKNVEIPAGINEINKNLANTVTVDCEFFNDRTPGMVTIVKNALFNNSSFITHENLTDGVTLAGAEFELYRITDDKDNPLKEAVTEVICVDSDGREHTIANTDGTAVKVVTGKDGQVTIKGLEWGRYRLYETKAPNGYQTKDSEIYFDFAVDAQNVVQKVYVDNEQIPATLDIAKYEMLEDGSIAENPKPLSGAKFELWYSSKKDGDYTCLDVYTTNEVGKITVQNLPYGFYYLKEIDLPTGYKYVDAKYLSKLPELSQGCTYAVENDVVTGIKFELFPDENVNAEHNVNFSVNNYNQRKLATVSFAKADADDGDENKETFVSGARYVLCKKYKDGEERNGISPGNDDADKDYYIVDNTGTAMQNGYEKVKNINYFETETSQGIFYIKDLYWGTYYLREIAAPKGYQLNKAYIEFSVDEKTVNNEIVIRRNYEDNEDKYKDACDYRIKGKVKLTKIDETKAAITGDGKSARFALYKDGTLYGEYETNPNDGTITVTDLPWGVYYFEETSAPAGYSISKDKVWFTIDSSSNECEVEVVNKIKTSELTISKTIKADDIVFSHGTPTFFFRIEQLDDLGHVVATYHNTIVFDEKSVEKYRDPDDGTVTLSTTTTVNEACYKVTELETNRYKLSSANDKISAYTKPDGSDEETRGEVGDDYAVVNLKATSNVVKNISGFVNFKNDKIKQSSTSSSSIKPNIFANGKLCAITAEWNGGDAFAGNVIDTSKIKVTAQYDNNSMKVISPSTVSNPYGYVLQDQNDVVITNFNDNAGTMVIKVSYTEDGITRTTSFTVNLISVSDLFTWQIISQPTDDNPVGTARITGYTGLSNEIEIPDHVFGLRQWNDNEDGISYDTHPEYQNRYKVTEIGYQVDSKTYKPFRINKTVRENIINSDDNLKLNISLPNTIVKISDYAFRYNADDAYSKVFKKLTGIQPIGKEKGNDIILPDSVTTIGDYAFYGCTGLKGKLKLPNSLNTIGYAAFSKCTGLLGTGSKGELELPNSVETIGGYAFYICTGLKGDLIFSDNVKTIGEHAFHSCTGLSGDLKFPDTITTIGSHAFQNCTGLSGDLVLPNSVTTIGEFAFCNIGIQTLKLPENDLFTTINKETFENCKNLSSIDFGKNSKVETIEYGAFANTALKNTLPKEDGKNAITFPDSLKTIGVSSFSNSIAINRGQDITKYGVSVIFGTGIQSIGSSAFKNCGGIKDIKFSSVISNEIITYSDTNYHEEPVNGDKIITDYVKFGDKYQLKIICKKCPIELTIGSEAFANLTEFQGEVIYFKDAEGNVLKDAEGNDMKINALVFPCHTEITSKITFTQIAQHGPKISGFLPQGSGPGPLTNSDRITLYSETADSKQSQ